MGKGEKGDDVGSLDRELERRLSDWAMSRGVDYVSARRVMTDGDVAECIRMLRLARERRDRREADCVLFYLRMKAEESGGSGSVWS